MNHERSEYGWPARFAAVTAIGSACANWVFEPDKALLWAALVALIGFGAVAPFILLREQKEFSDLTRRHIERGLFWAFLTLAAVLGLSAAQEAGLVAADISKRAGGLFIGAVFVGAGNFLPKIVTPIAARRVDPSRAQAAERFAGRLFVAAGALYCLIWLFAPIDAAKLYGSAIGLTAFAAVLAVWLRVWLRAGRDTNSTMGETQMSNHSTALRITALLLLNGIFWAFAMILIDSVIGVGGDAVVKWIALAFVVFNGVLAAFLLRPLGRSE